MKKVFLFVFMAITAMNTNAQGLRLGITGGMNINCPSGENGQASKTGFDVGIKGELGLPDVSDGLYADFGVMLSLRGSKSSDSYHNSITENSGKLNYNNYNLMIPVHVGYKFDVCKDVKLFVNAGPYVGIGLFGKLKYTDNGKTTTLSDNVYGDKLISRFDWGLGARAGAELSRHYQLSIGYDYGIKDLKTDKNPVSRKNRAFSVAVAYMF